VNVTLHRWKEGEGWKFPERSGTPADWLLYFGSCARLDGPSNALLELVHHYPRAVCCGCSTAGEIFQGKVGDDGLVAAAVRFDDTQLRAASAIVGSADGSREAGAQLARSLRADELRHVFVLCDGLRVNGTLLLNGLREGLPEGVRVSGGMAGDGTRFGRTLVGLGASLVCGHVVAVGFYGHAIRIGCAAGGGWDAFGPRRRITRSKGSILYELDGQPALDLYRRYLGERAAGLPATGLLFPLELLANASDKSGLVRTILSIDEREHSLTFAGDMPEGCYARLMKAQQDGLILGAARAGQQSSTGSSDLTVLISCVGRRLVLGQQVELEVEAAMAALDPRSAFLGFYSYGEICPSGGLARCDLHNQTMTITTFAENKAGR
jgi:hypothetical protein